jgi:hypothetical protein
VFDGFDAWAGEATVRIAANVTAAVAARRTKVVDTMGTPGEKGPGRRTASRRDDQK